MCDRFEPPQRQCEPNKLSFAHVGITSNSWTAWAVCTVAQQHDVSSVNPTSSGFGITLLAEQDKLPHLAPGLKDPLLWFVVGLGSLRFDPALCGRRVISSPFLLRIRRHAA